MVRTIIQQLAIFLVPLLLYFIYFQIERRRARKKAWRGRAGRTVRGSGSSCPDWR